MDDLDDEDMLPGTDFALQLALHPGRQNIVTFYSDEWVDLP